MKLTSTFVVNNSESELINFHFHKIVRHHKTRNSNPWSTSLKTSFPAFIFTVFELFLKKFSAWVSSISKVKYYISLFNIVDDRWAAVDLNSSGVSILQCYSILNRFLAVLSTSFSLLIKFKLSELIAFSKRRISVSVSTFIITYFIRTFPHFSLKVASSEE